VPSNQESVTERTALRVLARLLKKLIYNTAQEEKEEEKELYLRLEACERVQTNEAKSKRRRALPT
jgi:hypothetical protein